MRRFRSVSQPGRRSVRSALLGALLMGALALGLVAMHDVGSAHGVHDPASQAAQVPVAGGGHTSGGHSTGSGGPTDSHHGDVPAVPVVAAASAVGITALDVVASSASDALSGSLLADCALAVACALALAVVAALALGARPTPLGRLRPPSPSSTSGCLAPLAGRRPDLHALSISRT